jgi:aerobic-type carbon monoxide dehydrogenase small subunit (CoxS/CutS family)
VEVLFIDINGEDVEVEEKDTFLLCATLSQWIHKTGSKGSRKVFSCLKRPPILGTNNYSRGAFLFE